MSSLKELQERFSALKQEMDKRRQESVATEEQERLERRRNELESKGTREDQRKLLTDIFKPIFDLYNQTILGGVGRYSAYEYTQDNESRPMLELQWDSESLPHWHYVRRMAVVRFSESTYRIEYGFGEADWVNVDKEEWYSDISQSLEDAVRKDKFTSTPGSGDRENVGIM